MTNENMKTDKITDMLAYMLDEEETEAIKPEYIHAMTTKEELILDACQRLCRSVAEEDIPTDKSWEIAKEILDLFEVSPGYSIYEIPLCWDDQVNIRFYYPEAETIFNIAAGITSEDPNIFFLEVFAEYDTDDETRPCGEVCLYKDKAVINEALVEENDHVE